jgi:hypothetical protein
MIDTCSISVGFSSGVRELITRFATGHYCITSVSTKPGAGQFGNLVFAVTSIGSQRRTVSVPDMEVAMNRMMLKFPSSFSETFKQFFVGGRYVAPPDLQSLSDRCLADIGLTRYRMNFEVTKPSWLA